MIYWQLNLLTNDKFAWFYCFRICVLCISDVSCACECECPNHSTAQRISFINIDSVWGSRLCLYQNQLSVSWFVYERDYCFQNISKKCWARDLPLKYAETNNKQPLVYTVIKFLYSWTSFGWSIIFAPLNLSPLHTRLCWLLSSLFCALPIQAFTGIAQNEENKTHSSAEMRDTEWEKNCSPAETCLKMQSLFFTRLISYAVFIS